MKQICNWFLLFALCASLCEVKLVQAEDMLPSVTGSRLRSDLSTLPPGTVVIGPRETAALNVSNVAELLRHIPFLTLSDIQGNGREYGVGTMGSAPSSTSGLVVLIDGRRVNLPGSDGVDWAQIPISSVSRVEILPGGLAGVEYGDGAANGVVNIVTKTEGQNSFGVAWKSYARVNAQASYGKRLPLLEYNFSLDHHQGGHYRKNAESKGNNGTFSMALKPEGGAYIKVFAGTYQDNTRRPGALSETDLASGFSGKDSTVSGRQVQTNDRYFVATPEFLVTPEKTLAFTLYDRQHQSVLTYPSGGAKYDITSTEESGFGSRLMQVSADGESDGRMAIGFDFRNSTELFERSVSSPGGTSAKVGRITNAWFIESKKAGSDGTYLSFGARDETERFSFSPGSPARMSYRSSATNFGIGFPVEESVFYFSVSQGFKYPLSDQLFDPSTNLVNSQLGSQKIRLVETGIKKMSADGSFSYLQLFRSSTDGEVVYDPLVPGYTNLTAPVVREGIAFTYGKRTSELSVEGTVSSVKAVITGGTYTGSTIPDLPDKKYSFKTVYFMADGFTFSFEAIKSGKRYFAGDLANSFGKVGDATTFDLSIGQDTGSSHAYFAIRNVTGTRYNLRGEINGGMRSYYPGPGRSLEAGFVTSY